MRNFFFFLWILGQPNSFIKFVIGIIYFLEYLLLIFLKNYFFYYLYIYKYNIKNSFFIYKNSKIFINKKINNKYLKNNKKNFTYKFFKFFTKKKNFWGLLLVYIKMFLRKIKEKKNFFFLLFFFKFKQYYEKKKKKFMNNTLFVFFFFFIIY